MRGFKTECIRTTIFHAGPYRTLSDVEFATAGWVDWYNNRCLHGSLGMLTTVGFETLHYEAINGRLEQLRGTGLGFRNLSHYIARGLLDIGGFKTALHRPLSRSSLL